MSRSSVRLDQARLANDKGELALALDENLELWLTIKTIVMGEDSQFDNDLKNNLTKLADYVAATTLQQGVEISETALDTMININLQISEGLLEGGDRAAK